MLSPKLLELLRDWYRIARHGPAALRSVASHFGSGAVGAPTQSRVNLALQVPPSSATITGPNSCQCSPVKRRICICLSGA